MRNKILTRQEPDISFGVESALAYAIAEHKQIQLDLADSQDVKKAFHEAFKEFVL